MLWLPEWNDRNANFDFVSKKSKMKKQQQSTSGEQKATTYNLDRGRMATPSEKSLEKNWNKKQ